MSLKELSPGRLSRPHRRWLDAVLFENIPNRVVCQIVAQLPVCADSPSIDSPEPCGQPEQRFPDQLRAAPELGTQWVRYFAQSVFCATSTEFPVRRSSLPAPTSWAQAFSLWPPIVGADHRELQTPVTHLFAKDPILLDQICDHFLLMAAHPAGNRSYEKPKWAQRRTHRQIL